MAGPSRRGTRSAENRQLADRRRSRSRRRQRKRDKEKAAPHFGWEPGMRLGADGRYVVESLLGDGTFGRVLGCVDSATKDFVAIKVVKGVRRYCEHAEAEVEILQEVHAKDTRKQSLCVELLDSFLHAKRHFCMVFEPLDINIRDFLKANDSLGLYMADIRQLTQQLLQSLSFLHGIGLTHTDLKCRNVMLRDGRSDLCPHPRVPGRVARRPRSCQLALIDFGGAVFPDERQPGRVGTRQFRAPEIVMGLPWDESSDMWSAGCIVAMLYLGQRPFSMHEDMEHLAMMERLLKAKIPPWMVQQALEDEEPVEGIVFDSNQCLAWPAAAPEPDAVDRVRALPSLCECLAPRHVAFLRLAKGLLDIDPRRRLTATSALAHQFLADVEVVE